MLRGAGAGAAFCWAAGKTPHERHPVAALPSGRGPRWPEWEPGAPATCQPLCAHVEGPQGPSVPSTQLGARHLPSVWVTGGARAAPAACYRQPRWQLSFVAREARTGRRCGWRGQREGPGGLGGRGPEFLVLDHAGVGAGEEGRVLAGAAGLPSHGGQGAVGTVPGAVHVVIVIGQCF